MKSYLPILLLCLACRDDRKPNVDSGMDTDTDTDTPDLLEQVGCDSTVDLDISVSQVRTSAPTVPRFNWESSEPISVRMYTDIGRSEPLETPISETASTTGELLVLGIPVNRAARAVLVADTEEGRACSEILDIDAAFIDPGIPELTVGVWDPEQTVEGFTTVGLITESSSYVVIVDSAGEYVWFRPTGIGVVSRALFSEFTPSVLYMTWAESVSEAATIYRLGMDGEIIETFAAPGGHTDFTELPDGSMAVLGWDLRVIEDEFGEPVSVLGDNLVEIDAEGNQRVLWSVFDDFSVDLSQKLPMTTIGSDVDILDWSHANGLSYDAVSDDYLISIFGLGSLVRVDRETGQVDWTLSDSGGDFQTPSDEGLIRGTHSVQFLEDDRYLVFNRNIPNPMEESPDIENACSEAVEFQLDMERGEASRLWSYGSEECLYVLFFGEAIRLEDGNTLTIFSSAGQISEATSSGETVWEINLDVGASFGFGNRIESLYGIANGL